MKQLFPSGGTSSTAVVGFARRATATGLLLWFFLAAILAGRQKSTTYDEVLHVTAGCTYWLLGDYRLQPTNGNLMQRWIAAPVLLLHPTLSARNGDDWCKATKLGEDYGKRFFHSEGNDLPRMLLLGRAAVATLGVLLGILVYRWSRRVFGRGGALWSLALYCFCPNFLAHAGLATSDVAAALFFTAATWSWQRLLNRLTVGRLWLSLFAVAGLFGVKMSAPLFLLVAALLAVVRLALGREWAWRWRERRGAVRGFVRQASLLAAAGLLHGAFVFLTLWSAYGFRYSAFAEYKQGRDDFTEPWPSVLQGLGWKGDFLAAVSSAHLLSEAYLYGMAHTLKHASKRPAFLNGKYSDTGWTSYFPLVFAMKTPLPTLTLLAVAAGLNLRRFAAARSARKRAIFLQLAPLCSLFTIYGAAAIASSLNIGYRHILPLLPALFVAAGVWGRANRLLQSAAFLLLLWLAVESAGVHPHYLAYFNQLVGGPSQGYRHLVDSNLDWGQDLAGLKSWLDEQRLSAAGNAPVYLAYFGTGDPKYYCIDAAAPLESHLGPVGIDDDADLAGVYCLSATMLVAPSRGRSPWSETEEQLYRRLQQQLRDLVASGRGGPEVSRAQKALTSQLLTAYQLRLKNYLLSRTPDHEIGYSILIYRLSNAEVRHALFDADWRPGF